MSHFERFSRYSLQSSGRRRFGGSYGMFHHELHSSPNSAIQFVAVNFQRQLLRGGAGSPQVD